MMSHQPVDRSMTDPDPGLLVVPRLYRVSPGVAHPAYVAGRLAERLAAPAVEVTLLAPSPTDTAFRIGATLERAWLTDVEGRSVATAIGVPPIDLDLPELPSTLEATSAGYRNAGDRGSNNECFVTGLRRRGEGLRIMPGPVDRDLWAATWIADARFADGRGVVPPSIVWSVLGGTMLASAGAAGIRSLRAEIRTPIEADAVFVVTAWKERGRWAAALHRDGVVSALARGELD